MALPCEVCAILFINSKSIVFVNKNIFLIFIESKRKLAFVFTHFIHKKRCPRRKPKEEENVGGKKSLNKEFALGMKQIFYLHLRLYIISKR